SSHTDPFRGEIQPSVFGQSPAFGQTPSLGQDSVFGQSGGLGQTSGQTSTFSSISQPPAFGQSSLGQGSSGFGGASSGPTTTTTAGSAQPLSFGQPQPSATTTSFATAQSVVQSRGFSTSEFSFKPSNEVLFKPIFSACPEPANPQPTAASEQPFGFSLLTGFTFSQPSALSSNNSSTATLQPAPVPSSPSSFSFSTKVLQSQPAPPMSLFGAVSFGQTSTFGDLKTEAPAEEKVGDDESTREVTVFGRVGKGTKRKEEPASPKAAPRKPAQSEDAQAEARADLPRHPSKRPLLRSSRGPVGGLFSRAMSGIMKSTANSVRRDPVKEEQQPPGWGEGERADTQAPISLRPATPPSAQVPTREVLEKAEVTDAETKTPARRRQRRESTDSLGGMSPTDATILQCKSIPLSLNKKNVIEKHFGRFGKVCRVYCRPHKNLAIVHFQDHASAAKAKKKGKMLHRQEIVIFWQRKKHNIKKDTLFLSSPVKKPSIVKTLQFESEPQQDSSSEGQSSDRPVPSSLLHLIGQLAETAEEKYRLLEQRDKILRAGRPKRTDLELSFFVGTCPDMCPEKERYMRETRNQLSCFEVIPDTERVDHVAAIKEYSRSSADQEEPLPYELRPLPVLSMTMDYLVTQIMDQGHDNYRDWYDFVWNRTRGIRKDITQQHLCDPLTVSLIEKCTRFHVHCAHHLCQEHMMTFDAKINNENMTKCLQSLKEMYQDLSTRGVYCPQEAEFRQYNVLLKLDVGDVLREVQQFRDEVRNSPEVKFAVHAFAALNSNNFVRFFKLVKSASYLASCLLHRYFNQVRGKALRTLNNAHTAGSQRSTIFPLEDLVRMLMFEDAAEATDFIQQFGLNISGGLVELSRTAWQEPDLNLPQVKSDIIMAKRAVLIGEVVNGGSLPNPPQHAPVCSFDAHNKYWGEGPLAEPTLAAVFRSSPVAVTELESVVEEVLEEVVWEVASTGADYAAAALGASSGHMEAVVSEVVEQMLREVSTAEVQAERERLAEEKRRIEEARLVRDSILTLAANPYAKCMHCFPQKVLHNKKTCKLPSPHPLSPYFFLSVRWRDVVAVRRQLKRQMRGFPAAPCCVDPRYKLKALAPSAPSQPSMDCLARGMVNLGNAGYMALSSTRLLKMRQEAIHQMRVHFYYQQLLNESVWTPLDMPTLVVENVPNPPDRIFWKATLLLPSDHESVASIADSCTDFVCVCCTYQASRGPLSEEGLSNLEEAQELQGTGALLMLLPAPSPGSEDQDVPMLSALLQLKQLQQANIWDCPLPLAILVPGPHNTQKLEEDLMLQTLVEDGLISEHVFVHIPETTSDLQGSEQVSQAVRWLLARAPAPSLLSSQTLVHFVEAGLGREFSARLYGHRQDRAGAGLARQHPAPVIKLYNAVLAFLADLVSSQHLSSLSWPPGEFALPETRDLVPHLGWNSPQHLAWLRTAVVSLQIPSWEMPANTASWPQLCSAIFQYASQIPTSRHSQPLLMSRLENLLERVRCSTTGAQDHWEEGPSFQQVPWDEVVALCIDHKLKDWQPPDSPVCDGEMTIGLSTLSALLKAYSSTLGDIFRLAALPPFFRASPGGLAAFPPLRQKLFRSLVDWPERSAPCHTLDITHTPSPRDLLPHKVLHGLQEERAHSQRCEEQLQRWLEVEPLDSLSMPLFMPSSLLSATNIMAPIRTSGGASTATQVRLSSCAHTYTHTHTYMCTHTHVHIYAHTCTHKLKKNTILQCLEKVHTI
uniref:Germinal-center associated nuclear protein n=1 Tax=Hucho hucho TaxID=62062 RepID=A0A4W5P0G4_9TELE